MHVFADPADVIATLGQLAARPAPLVRCSHSNLAPEARYVELLSDTVDSKPAEPTPLATPLSDKQRMQQLEADNQSSAKPSPSSACGLKPFARSSTSVGDIHRAKTQS